jgi:hypothetical protein
MTRDAPDPPLSPARELCARGFATSERHQETPRSSSAFLEHRKLALSRNNRDRERDPRVAFAASGSLYRSALIVSCERDHCFPVGVVGQGQEMVQQRHAVTPAKPQAHRIRRDALGDDPGIVEHTMDDLGDDLSHARRLHMVAQQVGDHPRRSPTPPNHPPTNKRSKRRKGPAGQRSMTRGQRRND